MKTFKVDFSKGINVVTDKRLVPEGYVVLADNVDLRSGSLHPFKFPESYLAIPGGVPANTVCLYEFKGNWFFSTHYRDYTAEYVSAQTRVYFCETNMGGTYNPTLLPPQKVVNGIQAGLGSLVPLIAPTVNATTADTPSGFIGTASTTGGNLATGQYSYRISAVVAGQILVPSQAVIVNIPQVAGANITTGEVVLSWNPVQTATGYVVFGRILGQEQIMFTLGAGSATVTDTGSNTPAGAFASNYQPLNPLTYVYTYVRDVGTMQDESGPSPQSNPVNSSYVRVVSRNPLNDGLYANAVTYTATLGASAKTASVIGSYSAGKNTTLTLSAALSANDPWWVAGMNLVFGADASNTLYTFSIPSPLATPLAPGNPSLSLGVGTLVNGTYSYKVAAIRGAVTGLVAGATPATTPASPASGNIVVTTGPTAAVNVSWTGVAGASGYILYRYNGTNYQQAAIITGNTPSYTDTGAGTTVVTPPTTNDTGVTMNAISAGSLASWQNPTASYVGRIIVVTEALAGTFLTSIPTSAATVTLAYSPITAFSPTFAGVDQDVFDITAAPSNASLGVATYFNQTFGVAATWLNIYTPASGAGTISLLDVPNNGYYKYWNIYRAGDSGTTFAFVTQQPIGVTTFTDTVGTTGLGGSLPTEYPDPDTGGIVIFAQPPVDLRSPHQYNGMTFGISGNSVRWTPTGEPDAWPLEYSQSFPYPPQCLLAHAGGLWIFCEDKIYRMDGFTPGAMGVQDTKADGCIAPYSPRVVGMMLVYLAKRGIMVISNMGEAICVTEHMIPYRLLTQPSSYIGGIMAQSYWWNTTDHLSSYGALLDIGMNPIPAADGYGVVAAKDKPMNSIIWEARSFVWQHKYYLYFSTIPTAEFIGNPCWCVDFGTLQQMYQLANRPITTLGFKPTDVHVSSTGECYALLSIDPTNDPTNQTLLAAAESVFNSAFTPLGSPSAQAVFRFNPSFGQNVPMRVRTSEITAGTPQDRKRWREVRLNGSGTCQMRVFVDGVLWPMANGSTVTNVTLSESPIHPSRVLLPTGSWGYSCSVEFCGDVTVRLIALGYDPMTGDDRQGE